MTIRYVLFDHDGTLLSTLALRSRALEAAVMEVTGKTVQGEEIFARVHGQSLDGLSGLLTDGDPAAARRLVQIYRAHYYGSNGQGLEAYPGIAETLEGLRQRGVTLAVVTSKLRKGAIDELTGCGLGEYFEAFVGADDVTRHKPDAEPLLKAMSAISAELSDTLMVGDTTADIGGAKAANVRSAAALWDAQDEVALRAAGPDHLLTTPLQLLDIVDTER